MSDAKSFRLSTAARNHKICLKLVLFTFHYKANNELLGYFARTTFCLVVKKLFYATVYVICFIVQVASMNFQMPVKFPEQTTTSK